MGGSIALGFFLIRNLPLEEVSSLVILILPTKSESIFLAGAIGFTTGSSRLIIVFIHFGINKNLFLYFIWLKIFIFLMRIKSGGEGSYFFFLKEKNK